MHEKLGNVIFVGVLCVGKLNGGSTDVGSVLLMGMTEAITFWNALGIRFPTPVLVLFDPAVPLPGVQPVEHWVRTKHAGCLFQLFPAVAGSGESSGSPSPWG